NGGLVNNSSGYDIGFYPDCSGSGTALKWEMESYTQATGAIVAHVLRPTLSHTADDTIGMFYGGGQRTFQRTVSAAWDSDYKADGALLIQKRDPTTPANNYNYSLWVDGTTHQMFFQFNDGSYRNFDSNTVVGLNAWHYLVVTVDETLGSNKIKFYLDGAADG